MKAIIGFIFGVITTIAVSLGITAFYADGKKTKAFIDSAMDNANN